MIEDDVEPSKSVKRPDRFIRSTDLKLIVSPFECKILTEDPKLKTRTRTRTISWKIIQRTGDRDEKGLA